MSIIALRPASGGPSNRALSAWPGDEPELRLLPSLCCGNELSLDIGANQGAYAWHLAHHSKAVIAFEPQPGPAAFVFNGGRVTVERVALSDGEGEAILRLPRDRIQGGRATIEPENGLNAFETTAIVVPRRRLDSYGFERVGFIKIDVEGHELAVLEGGRGLLDRHLPTLIVEADDRHRPRAIDSVSAFLSGFGYRGAFLRGGALVPIERLGTRGLGAGAAALGISSFVFAARTGMLAGLAV